MEYVPTYLCIFSKKSCGLSNTFPYKTVSYVAILRVSTAERPHLANCKGKYQKQVQAPIFTSGFTYE